MHGHMHVHTNICLCKICTHVCMYVCANTALLTRRLDRMTPERKFCQLERKKLSPLTPNTTVTSGMYS